MTRMFLEERIIVNHIWKAADLRSKHPSPALARSKPGKHPLLLAAGPPAQHLSGAAIRNVAF
eukprot:COSAG01_NODE_27764_length_677_cov_1.463668_1_plen_61_part_10